MTSRAQTVPGEAELIRRNELLRDQLEKSRRDHDSLAEQLAELKKSTQNDRETRLAALNLMEDAIEARQAEQRENQERRRAEEDLRQADLRKDEFLAILAHELRNPLAPLRNSLSILRLSTQGDPATQKISEMMERQVTHMVRLVDDLMEVSRISQGKVELRKEAIEVAVIVRNAVETSRPLIESAGHQLNLDICAEPLTIEGDAVRLTQIVANLLNNAAKYTSYGGKIWLIVRPDGEDVRISVRDTGSGIPSHMLTRVFELFTQVNRGESRAQGGLGIGLTLVKSLVEMHGGSVEAQSDGVGQGSEFIVRLPLSALVAVGRPEGETHARLPTFTPRRVLVVDDNQDAADSLGALLKLLGADVRVVYRGFDALQAVEEYRPAVVLLDIGIPDMNGYEVARRIRDEGSAKDVTLIAVTGWGQETDRTRSKSAGFQYHLTKPTDIRVLGALLSSLDDGTIKHESTPITNRKNQLLHQVEIR